MDHAVEASPTNEDDRPTVPVLDPDVHAFLAGVDAWGMTSDVANDDLSWWLAQRRRWLAIYVGAFVGLCVGVLVIAFALAAAT
jgi:hypothetical protein